jgi:hypothetical protein
MSIFCSKILRSKTQKTVDVTKVWGNLLTGYLSHYCLMVRVDETCFRVSQIKCEPVMREEVAWLFLLLLLWFPV